MSSSSGAETGYRIRTGCWIGRQPPSWQWPRQTS